MKTTISRWLLTGLLAAAALAAHAGTKEEVQADIQAGRWQQADTKLEEVLQKHPDNALAHYWLAQVDWHEGRVEQAREHLATAERLDPEHRFAGDKAALAKFERGLAGKTAAARSELPRVQDNSAALSAPPPAPVSEAPSSSHHISAGLVIAFIALVVFIVWASRAARRRQQGADLDLIKSQLQEAGNDLRDAGKALDARADLSMEQRLALSDRVVRAQGDIAAHLARLQPGSDPAASHELLRRVRDIAAEVRGEPRPSEIEAQRALEAQRWQAAQGNTVVVNNPGMGGPGLGGVGAALGGLAAGVVLGEMMSGSAHARTTDTSGSGYTPIDTFDPNVGAPSSSDLDLGGSGDASWDSDGGGDLGGGGGDFD